MHGGEQSTHDGIVSGARRALVEALGLDDSAFAARFVAEPIGPRVRAGAVRASLARFAVEELSAMNAALRFGGYNEANDEVTVHLPATIEARGDLRLPVLWALTLKLEPFVHDIVQRRPGAVAADLLARERRGVAEISRRLQTTPPNFEAWPRLAAVDVARAFDRQPPLCSDRKELFQRIKLACSYAAERTVLDELARRNPGFLDYLQCFPVARSMQRKVVAWLGPTNSGKTHQAVIALSRAKSGMYLGPLRLLALEQRDRLVELGCPCSLITGEERDETSPTHSSRTVEMTDFSEQREVVVLDEMQLAFDRDRGWAWVAAYCGAAAETLIVTGPNSAESVIRRLAEVCGDAVEVNYLARQGTLDYEGVLDWQHVPRRSAVIGFSRAMVLELKAMFEAMGLRVSVIYGGLSPEVRRSEARRFRQGETDIVCATDAIGLGLNLPLDRVIFYEVDKYDGEVHRALTPGELMQIAGRAGRGPGAAGLVAGFSIRDGRRVASALAQLQRTPALDLLPAAPTAMHIRAIADHLGVERLTAILEFFRTRLAFPGGTFFPEVRENVFEAAGLVDSTAPSLPVEKRYALACAPVDLEDHFFRSPFTDWLELLDAGKKVGFPRRLEADDGLAGVEQTLKLITVYRWLALKFPVAFNDLEYVAELRHEATERAQMILRSNWAKHGLSRKECARCSRALLPSSPYRMCRECNADGFT